MSAGKARSKNVSDGYGRNFCCQINWANRHAVRYSFRRKDKKANGTRQGSSKDILEKNIKGLKDLKVQIKAKANEKGHLFSIIHPDEISKILKEQHHLDIPSKFIEIEKPIKELGEHTVKKTKHQEFILDVLAL